MNWTAPSPPPRSPSGAPSVHTRHRRSSAPRRLPTKMIAAAVVERQADQRRDDRVPAMAGRTCSRSHRRDQETLLHAVLAFDPTQPGAVAAASGALRRYTQADPGRHVVVQRGRLLRLRLIALDHLRLRRHQVGQGCIQGFLRDAGRTGVGAQLREPGGKFPGASCAGAPCAKISRRLVSSKNHRPYIIIVKLSHCLVRKVLEGQGTLCFGRSFVSPCSQTLSFVSLPTRGR